MSIHNPHRDKEECNADLVAKAQQIMSYSPEDILNMSYHACGGWYGVDVFVHLTRINPSINGACGHVNENFKVDIQLEHCPAVWLHIDSSEYYAELFVSNQSNPADGRETIQLSKEFTDAIEEYLIEVYSL